MQLKAFVESAFLGSMSVLVVLTEGAIAERLHGRIAQTSPSSPSILSSTLLRAIAL
ncbi:MAG: hypothetical protein AAF716_19835 [Cyanobacteria bacterium P01_D01_bin.1]